MGLHSVQDYEERARELLPSPVWEYYSYGRERRWCYQDSINAFSRYRIRMKILQDVSHRSLATTVLGQPIKYPICISPTALHCFAHRDGEKETARGAKAAETLMVLSADASTGMADVVDAAPGGLRWMQIYPFVDRELTAAVIREAERLGYKALVVTVDSPARGMDARINQIFEEHPIVDDPKHCMQVYDQDVPSARAAKAAGDTGYIDYLMRMQFNPSATWGYISWIQSISSLPVVCKGILTAEDAKEAADAGVDGILVSAHGGRQMDGSPAPIDALAEVVDAVRGRGVEVYMDGGVRTGTDIFKALGRGARAVFVGRPVLYGLACKGADGVRDVLHILRDQFDTVLAVSGCTSPSSIHPGAVVHESYYHRNNSQGANGKLVSSKL